MEYLLNVYKFHSRMNFNAGGKAPTDVTKSLLSLNFKEIPFTYYNNKSWFYKLPKGLFDSARLLFSRQFSRNEIVHIQDNSEIGTFLVLICKIKGAKIHYHIHDLIKLRSNQFNYQLLALKLSNKIYAHTERMVNYLVNDLKLDRNIITHIDLFDYYSESPLISKEKALANIDKVAFAGNLEKSEFLSELFTTNHHGIKYKLYGIADNITIPKNEHFEYCGKFEASNPAIVEAGWGLHWDGGSIATCSGLLGNYVRYIAPHKVSLYLSCGIPVIMWREAALAKWLEKQNAALLIDSLNDIPEMLAKISPQQYLEMLESVQKIANRLRKGDYLLSRIANNN